MRSRLSDRGVNRWLLSYPRWRSGPHQAVLGCGSSRNSAIGSEPGDPSQVIRLLGTPAPYPVFTRSTDITAQDELTAVAHINVAGVPAPRAARLWTSVADHGRAPTSTASVDQPATDKDVQCLSAISLVVHRIVTRRQSPSPAGRPFSFY